MFMRFLSYVGPHSRYGRHVMSELQQASPQIGDDQKKFLRFLIRVQSLSESPLVVKPETS